MAIDDLQLRHDIEAELDWDTRLDSRQVGVAVKNGVVALSGHVSCYAEKRAAEEAAQAVGGVRAVANDIVVELPSSAQCSDAELAEAAVGALERNVAVPDEQIAVYVREGWITLEGQVAMWFQKSAAETAVSSLPGVKGVSSNITISAQPSAEDVQTKIEDAFRRQARLDAREVLVAVSAGTVTLEGKVQSWGEKQQAEQAAWQAPGVSKVINNLNVRTR
jgi:osmotically-inducible protein OsmY